MAPRGFTLPPASTQSAKAARSAFFCALCQKGYSRMNEFEAHESSYDHQHKKRLKEMKEMQRQVQVQQPRKEEKGPLVQIKLGGKVAGNSSSGSGGFKKGGFKNAFTPIGGDDDDETDRKEDVVMKENDATTAATQKNEAEETDSDVTDDDDYYDPRKPTGCMPGCKGHFAASNT